MLFINSAYNARRISGCDGVCVNITRHDRSRADNGVIAYGYSRQYDRAGAYPYTLAYAHGRGDKILSVFRRKTVVKSCDYNIMTYERAVAYIYPALILKAAAGIDKYVFADGVLLLAAKPRYHPV